jgi:hypothetical protein
MHFNVPVMPGNIAGNHVPNVLSALLITTSGD